MRYDGETLYQGLLLAYGPVARRFPEIWGALRGQLPSVGEAQAAKVDEGITRKIKARDPGFLDRFALDIQSGDPVLVEAALVEAVRLGKGALTSSGVRPASLVCDPDDPFPPPECGGENVVTFFAFTAIAAMVDGGRLMRDQAVRLISDRLSLQP